jgi:hypothetical protein
VRDTYGHHWDYHQKKTLSKITKARIKIKALQKHGKEIKKANMDFKNIKIEPKARTC